jgi:hypothetical protein
MSVLEGGANMRSKSNWRGWSILALSVGYLLQTSAFAAGQAPGSATPQIQTQRQSRRPSLDDRVSRFAKNLGLTEAQQTAVKKILEQQREEILRIRTDPSLTGGTAIDRFRALQERTVAQIRSVLNDEQKKIYNPLAPRTIPQTPQPTVEDWLKATTPPR